jgi:hypothetical protein
LTAKPFSYGVDRSLRCLHFCWLFGVWYDFVLVFGVKWINKGEWRKKIEMREWHVSEWVFISYCDGWVAQLTPVPPLYKLVCPILIEYSKCEIGIPIFVFSYPTQG